jgi:hypothetical protein
MFSPPKESYVSKGRGRERERNRIQTRDNNILRPIQDLRTPILMPNRQIPTMQRTPSKQLPRRLVILQILLRADVAKEDDFSNLLAVFRDVDEDAIGLVGLDDPDRQAGNEAVTLARHSRVFFFGGERVPDRHMVTFCDGPVGFG